MLKIEKKLIAWFWWLLAILPLLIFVVTQFHATSVIDFSTIISQYRFQFVYDILLDIITVGQFTMPVIILDFVSYYVSIELIRLFVEVVLFFIRFARVMLGGIYDKMG